MREIPGYLHVHHSRAERMPLRQLSSSAMGLRFHFDGDSVRWEKIAAQAS